ncbi:hypothetical protein AgCh_038822 [Apium graveolens]
MAGTGDDMGGFKGLEGDAGLSSNQDLHQQVIGGTMKENDNVCHDVFVGGVSVCDPIGDAGVEIGGVVVGIGGNDGGLLAETGKGGALHGEFLVESGSVGVVEDQVGLKDATVENEEVVGGVGRKNGCEAKVEDQVCEKDDESGVGVEMGRQLLGLREMTVR